ncbi:MAG: hypothetical protein FJZ90_09000 [Chloroflexi bacterium]|nr:hypothetical protein [Chloroflexota bacterium]
MGIARTLNGAGSPGARNDCWQSQEIYEFFPHFRDVVNTYPDGPQPAYTPANGRLSEFNDVVGQNLQAIFAGEVGIDEGLETAQKLGQEVLDLA